MKNVSIEELFYDKAKKEYDGHFTILGFSTNYAVCFGTLTNTMVWLSMENRDSSYENKCINYMAKGKTLEDAMSKCISKNINNMQIHKNIVG